MVDADTTLGAEHTGNLIAAIGATRKLLCLTSHRQALLLDRHGHAEGATGLALAFLAMTGEQGDRLCRYNVTH
jgi:hypothetical protein